MNDFKVGDEVYAWRKSLYPESWQEFLHRYPNQIFKIKAIGSDGRVINEDSCFGFNPSDLSPILTFEGQRVVWKGKEGKPLKGEVIIDEVTLKIVRADHFKWEEAKILEPLDQEEPMELRGMCGDTTTDSSFKKPKWIGLKAISVQTLYDEGACRGQLGKFADSVIGKGGFSPTEELPPNYAQSVAESIDEPTYLPDHGFIERAEEERTYHVGQRFNHNNGEYILIPCGLHSFNLVHSSFQWTCNSKPIEVSDLSKITEAEFRRVFHSYEFELIE